MEVRYSPSGLLVVSRADATCPTCNGARLVSCPGCMSAEEAGPSLDGFDGDEGRAQKYSAAELKHLLSIGHALPNKAGAPSFPVEDVHDLARAIEAVGWFSGDPAALRRSLMRRAKALGHSSMIPPSWQPSGALKSGRSITVATWCEATYPQRMRRSRTGGRYLRSGDERASIARSDYVVQLATRNRAQQGKLIAAECAHNITRHTT